MSILQFISFPFPSSTLCINHTKLLQLPEKNNLSYLCTLAKKGFTLSLPWPHPPPIAQTNQTRTQPPTISFTRFSHSNSPALIIQGQGSKKCETTSILQNPMQFFKLANAKPVYLVLLFLPTEITIKAPAMFSYCSLCLLTYSGASPCGMMWYALSSWELRKTN